MNISYEEFERAVLNELMNMFCIDEYKITTIDEEDDTIMLYFTNGFQLRVYRDALLTAYGYSGRSVSSVVEELRTYISEAWTRNILKDI